jgi:single-strand DNA-binding protein
MPRLAHRSCHGSQFAREEMNSFTPHAVGHLSRDSERVAREGLSCTRFCLLRSDLAGKDEDGVPREVLTSVWLTAFGTLGEVIARNARKGDQLIVHARMRGAQSTGLRSGRQIEHTFVVQGFRFGAPRRVKRRELLDGSGAEPASPDPARDCC